MLDKIIGWIAVLMVLAATASAFNVTVTDPNKKDTGPRVIAGVVIAFSDEIRGKYACALVETEKFKYTAVWYPRLHTNVVIGAPISYKCVPFTEPCQAVVFNVQQYRTDTGFFTLNKDDGGKRMHRSERGYVGAIGAAGSTYEKHIFKDQFVAISYAGQ